MYQLRVLQCMFIPTYAGIGYGFGNYTALLSQGIILEIILIYQLQKYLCSFNTIASLYQLSQY
jgi:hypothetical protein